MYYGLFGIIIYCLLLGSISRKSRVLSEILGIILITIITIIFGFRYGVGIDYFSYEFEFNYRYDEFAYEPIYSLLVYFIKVIFNKFHYLTFSLLLITNIFLYFSLKKYKISGYYLLISIFTYISNTALIFMNGIRQGVAVSIFMYASTYIPERNFKKYLLFLLLGAGFHKSILFLLPLYFLYKLKLFNFTLIKYIISIITCYLLVVSSASKQIINFFALIPTYSKYYGSSMLFKTDVNILSLGVLLKVVYSIILLYYVRNVQLDKLTNISKNYFLVGILLNILSISTFMYERVGYYFYIFEVIAIPLLLQKITNKNIKLFIVIITLISLILFYSANLFVNPEDLKLDYKSIFSK